ncbi:MAG: GNAT family N-acetyltransferase [Leptospiraceae bacterium]|nr:GNAT family N-acetyltransferase [Leptospiraceae bacterium]MCP5498798.1 GNAT family N-acetyltransferase [Leptospiraceae bacterium]
MYLYEKPVKKSFENSHILLEPLCLKHAVNLFNAASEDPEVTFYHMFFGPFDELENMQEWIMKESMDTSKFTFAVYRKQSKKFVGTFSVSEIDSNYGTAELSSIWYATSAWGTETNLCASYLLLEYFMEKLKYRRLVWKCDDTNTRSKNAALKLGFKQEGVFRKHKIIKGRNRDTAWFSIIDDEWEEVKRMLENQINNIM